MEIRTAEEATEEYKSYDEWQYADREAAWKWMFERGVEAGNAHIYEAEAEQITRPLRELLKRQHHNKRWLLSGCFEQRQPTALNPVTTRYK